MMWRRFLAAMILIGGTAMAGLPDAVAQALPTNRSDLAYSYAPLVCLLYTSDAADE